MEVWILDKEFRSILLIDSFESLLWTERYNGAGNFEIYTTVDLNMLKMVNKDFYAWMADSDQVMIVETIQITTETETGNKMIFSGRSLESILDRKIIWTQTTLSGNLQNGVKKLLEENVINPSIADRRIPNFIFEESDDPVITSLKWDAQYTGDNLYDTIYNICNANNLGFQVTLDASYRFVFKLYAGKNRTYDQLENPYIIFSPKFENVINSNYIESDKTLKNVALVAGEDSGAARKTIVVGAASGLNRRELYVDARDIQSETSSGETLSAAEYNDKLRTRGEEKLAEYETTKTFEGEMETTKTFVYGRDFFKGDVVQFVNEYDMETKVRVMEIIRSQDTTGYSTYPTFSVIE